MEGGGGGGRAPKYYACALCGRTISNLLPTGLEKVVEAITRVPPDSSEMSVRPIIIPLVLVSVYTTNDSCTSYSTCDNPV